jgi:hypothetical protein
MRTLVSMFAIASGFAIAVSAQDAPIPAGPSFEVASVKRTVGSGFQRSGFIPTPGRFVAIDVPAQTLICRAPTDWCCATRARIQEGSPQPMSTLRSLPRFESSSGSS